MKDKINFKNLNELIKVAHTLLKILLILGIGTLIVLGFMIVEKTKILSFVITVLGLMMPLFVGLLVAWLFEPIILKLEGKKISRILASVITYVSFLLVLVFLLILVVPEFISQLKELVGQVPSFLSKITDFITNIFNNFKDGEIDVESIQKDLTLTIEKITTNLTSDSLTGIINAITKLISEGFSVLLGILIGFYISVDYKKVTGFMNKLIPIKYKDDVESLFSDLNDMARGYVGGTLFTSLLVAFLTFLGLIIAGVSSPLLFAIFCGVTNIIPYFGPYIGGIPVIIVGFSISPACGLICLITILLVQFIEGNIIHPLVVGKAIDIHPVVIVISLLIFEYYFGILGMILAAPIIGAVKILFTFFDKKYNIINRIKPNKLEVK